MPIEAIDTARLQARLPESVIVDNMGKGGKDQINGQGQAGGKAKPPVQISEALMKALNKNMETIHDVGIEFSVQNNTGRTVIRVVDKDTGKLIRQIPPQELLDLAAKLEDMMGILFDKRV